MRVLQITWSIGGSRLSVAPLSGNTGDCADRNCRPGWGVHHRRRFGSGLEFSLLRLPARNRGVETRHHWHSRMGVAVLREPAPKRLSVVGYRQLRSWPSGEAQRRTRKAVAGIAVAIVLYLPLSFLGTSAGNPSAYGSVHRASLALLLSQLLVCYPITVFAEETFFRGWLQPRLGPWGPIASALLWSSYHLEQWRTIPSLIPLGIILGVICWWTGNVRSSSVVHYLSNAVFFLTSYT
jgi:hypothetical protein